MPTVWNCADDLNAISCVTSTPPSCWPRNAADVAADVLLVVARDRELRRDGLVLVLGEPELLRDAPAVVLAELNVGYGYRLDCASSLTMRYPALSGKTNESTVATAPTARHRVRRGRGCRRGCGRTPVARRRTSRD